MEHINDIELLEYVSGKLTPVRSEQVQKHLAVCKQCFEHQQEIMQLWNILGQWDVNTAGHDISSRVIAEATKSQNTLTPGILAYITGKEFRRDILRIAALVIIAVGVGNRLGAVSTDKKDTPSLLSEINPKYIESFGLEWSSELTWLMMEDETSTQEQ